MAQKIHKNGKGDTRYFWNVTDQTGPGVYRSRHATAAGVRKEFSKNGQKVTAVRPVRA